MAIDDAKLFSDSMREDAHEARAHNEIWSKGSDQSFEFAIPFAAIGQHWDCEGLNLGAMCAI